MSLLLTVRCSKCSSRYRLSETLLGPGGARVLCPRCGESFEVPGPAGVPMTQPPASEPMPMPAEPAIEMGLEALGSLDLGGVPAVGGTSDEPGIAKAVLDDWATHAPALVAAHARGRLFSECGPVLFRAFDEYRRRAGPNASPTVFRDALRERWMIALGPARPGE